MFYRLGPAWLAVPQATHYDEEGTAIVEQDQDVLHPGTSRPALSSQAISPDLLALRLQLKNMRGALSVTHSQAETLCRFAHPQIVEQRQRGLLAAPAWTADLGSWTSATSEAPSDRAAWESWPACPMLC